MDSQGAQGPVGASRGSEGLAGVPRPQELLSTKQTKGVSQEPILVDGAGVRKVAAFASDSDDDDDDGLLGEIRGFRAEPATTTNVDGQLQELAEWGPSRVYSSSELSQHQRALSGRVKEGLQRYPCCAGCLFTDYQAPAGSLF